MAEHGLYKNAEGYVDPTAAEAIKGIAKPGEIWKYKGREVLIVKNQGWYSNVLTLSINPGKDKNAIEVSGGRYTTPGKLTYAFNDQLARKVETLPDSEFKEILCEITSILFFNPNSMMLAKRTEGFTEGKAMDKLRENLIAILQEPIYLHEQADPAVAVADYLMDNDVVPVVRCADCAYYFAVGEYCGKWDGERHPEHFCGDGKREDEVSECQACSIEGLE